MSSTRPIQFYFRGRVQQVEGVAPTRTVLQYLREDLHCTGTKEGCAEGDCGACTVVVGELVKDKLQLRAVNACIQFLPTLDGKALFTVEDLATISAEGLHPVQAAMVDQHGSQCGFCTPGFAMSLWAMYENRPTCPSRNEVTDTLSGNLCRCTGYKPILAAAEAAYQLPRVALPQEPVVEALREMAKSTALVYHVGTQKFWAPRDITSFASMRVEHPQACILAGSTDVGLWVTKQLRDLGDVLYTGDVAELKQIQKKGDQLEIGAAVSLTDAFAAMVADEPQWTELACRFASVPVRNAGTLGGNVANGSPIGDSMPGLIALGAKVILRRGEASREMLLEDFYIAYRQTALSVGEFVAAIRIPCRPKNGERLFRIWKVSKRTDQDISAVCGAFALRIGGGYVTEARIAFGGMSGIPQRAIACESELVGNQLSEATVQSAMAALAIDFVPMSDARASNAYRQAVAANLLQRLWLETRSSSTLLRVENVVI